MITIIIREQLYLLPFHPIRTHFFVVFLMKIHSLSDNSLASSATLMISFHILLKQQQKKYNKCCLLLSRKRGRNGMPSRRWLWEFRGALSGSLLPLCLLHQVTCHRYQVERILLYNRRQYVPVSGSLGFMTGHLSIVGFGIL